MDESQLLALFDQDQRIDIQYPDTRREVTPTVVRYVAKIPGEEGSVIYSHLDDASVEAAIQEQIDYFESLGQDFEWKLYDHDRPADLKDRLVAHGFLVEEAEAVLVLDLERAPDLLWQPVKHDIRRIAAPEKLSDVRRVEEQVWDEDFSWIGLYLGAALREHADQMSVYAAYIDEKPASAAWVYFPQHSQFASLWGGATLIGARKQGLYTALLALRAQEAKARHVRYLTVDASPMSRPILEKFGFELIAWTFPCKWKRKADQ
jgi:hypothetical protein